MSIALKKARSFIGRLFSLECATTKTNHRSYSNALKLNLEPNQRTITGRTDRGDISNSLTTMRVRLCHSHGRMCLNFVVLTQSRVVRIVSSQLMYATCKGWQLLNDQRLGCGTKSALSEVGQS